MRITLPYSPALSSMRPRCSACSADRVASAGAGSRVPGRVRTRARAWRRGRGRRRSAARGPAGCACVASSASPIARARAQRSRRSISSSTARAAWQATGLPTNVPPIVESPGASMISARPSTPGQRQAAGDRLGDADQIRLDAGLLDREERAGAAEAGLHLVGDEHDAVLVAELAQASQVGRGRGHEPALALDRLDHDRGDRLRSDARRERPAERIERLGRGVAVARPAVRVGERPRDRPRARTARSPPCTDAASTSATSPCACDRGTRLRMRSRGPAGGSLGDLDGVLDGLGATVEEGSLRRPVIGSRPHSCSASSTYESYGMIVKSVCRKREI